MSKRSTITFKRYGALPPPKVDIASATHNAKGEPYACYNLSTGEITPGVIKYRIKSHKQKDKPMWIKTEDNKNIWNLTKLANIEIFVRDSMHHVGFSGGFHSCYD